MPYILDSFTFVFMHMLQNIFAYISINKIFAFKTVSNFVLHNIALGMVYSCLSQLK